MIAALSERKRVAKLLSGFDAAFDSSANQKESDFERKEEHRAPKADVLGLNKQLLARMVAVVMSLIVGLSVSKWFLLAVPLYFAFEVFVRKKRSFQKSEQFERDYPAMLLSLASGVRTGLDPLSALLKVQESLPSASL